MFVQSVQSGSFVQVEGEDNLYTLTLEGVAPQTIAFSDRPERVMGQVPMQKFFAGLGFSPKYLPNAAIEILEWDNEEDVMVIELFDPVYDATNQTLQYNVSILEMPNHSYAIFNERHDESLPENSVQPLGLLMAVGIVICSADTKTVNISVGLLRQGCVGAGSPQVVLHVARSPTIVISVLKNSVTIVRLRFGMTVGTVHIALSSTRCLNPD